MMMYPLGLKIEIETVLDTSISGTVFAYSHGNKVLVVQTRSTGNTNSCGFRIVNMTFVRKTRALGDVHTNPVRTLDSENPVNRALQAESLYKIAISNPRASSMARKLFKHFLTYFSYDQIKWKGDDIEIRNEVRVCHPYSLHNIKGNPDSRTTEVVAIALKKFWLLQPSSDDRGG